MTTSIETNSNIRFRRDNKGLVTLDGLRFVLPQVVAQSLPNQSGPLDAPGLVGAAAFDLETPIRAVLLLDIEASVDWVEGRRYDSVASEAQIDERADELRSVWDLGRDPIPSLCELLEGKGIKVVEADRPESINGLSCHVLRGGEIVAEAVVVSSRINVERKRFMLTHELAHRIIRSTGNPAIDLEGALNRFAGAFLVPGQCLRDEVAANRHRITYYEIVRLKHIFGVSDAALLMRLGQVGVLPLGAVQHAFATLARTWRRSEPDPIRPDHGFAAFGKAGVRSAAGHD